MAEFSSEETQDALAALASPEPGYALTAAPHECVYQEADGTTAGACHLPGGHGGRLPEQPDPTALADEHRANRTFGDRPEVDAGAQALVWALTASQHGAELLELLHARFEGNEDNGFRAPEVVRELRAGRELEIAYHREAHSVAEKLAGMWGIVASAQPYEEVTLSNESGE